MKGIPKLSELQLFLFIFFNLIAISMIFTVAKVIRILFKSFIIQMLQTKKQEKEYLEILNNVSSGIIVLKQDSLEVKFSNQSAKHILSAQIVQNQDESFVNKFQHSLDDKVLILQDRVCQSEMDL
jgi:hypothetical protein